VDGLEYLLRRYKRRLKCGELKYVNLDCPDVDQSLIKRCIRSLNRFVKPFSMSYLPTLSKCDILFLTEDITPDSRALVKYAISRGIKTVVVQHGYPGQPHGFVPLMADCFLCWPEHYDLFLSWGMPEDRVMKFTPQRPEGLKYIRGVNAVFFLAPPGVDRHHQDTQKLYTEYEIYALVKNIACQELGLLVKPNPRYFEHLRRFLHPFNVTWANAHDLIYSAQRIYTFPHSTIIKDCEVLGKEAIVVG